MSHFLIFSLWPRKYSKGIKVEVDEDKNEEAPSLFDLFDESEVKKVKPEAGQKLSRRERFKKAMRSGS